MLYVILFLCLPLVGLILALAWMHDQTYKEPYIEPDPMEKRVEELKNRIHTQQMRIKAPTLKQIEKQSNVRNTELDEMRKKLMPKKSVS